MPVIKEKEEWQDIPSGVLRVLATLESAGEEAWLVGGCVRDHLRGCVPKDYDITTNASAQRVKELFEGFRVVDTGLKHGTVTVISEGMPLEVTTYRVDGSYSDGRHPDSVRFTSDIREDLSRRDFTVNAMAYSPVRGYLDLFGGTDDLRAGIIRCVGDPDRRFGEDALRILRAMRFASTLDFEIEPETAQAIHRGREMLGKIALERITKELSGILRGTAAGRVLGQFRDIMAQIIPPLTNTFDFEQHNPHHDCDVWTHTLRVVDASPSDRVMRLAALLHDIGKPHCFTIDGNGVGHFYGHASISANISETVFSEYLREDRRTASRVLLLVENHDEPIIPERGIIRRRLAKYGEEALRQLIALQRADVIGQKAIPDAAKLTELDKAVAILDELTDESACVSLKSLEINGGDLMAMGIPKGPMIGRILGQLLEEVCDEKLSNTHEALSARAYELNKKGDLTK